MAGAFDSAAALKSSGMNALKKGENLTRQQMSGLKGALRKAEAEYKKHGKITTGIFAGEDIKRVRSFKTSLKQMEIESSRTGVTIRTRMKQVGIGIKMTFQSAAVGVKLAFKGMALAAKGAAGAVNLAFRAVAIFGFIQLAMDGLKALTANFDKVMAGFASAIRMVGNGIAKLANFLSGIPLIGNFLKAGGESAQDKLEGIASSIESQLESGEGMIGQMAHKAKKERPGSILADQFESAQEKLKSLHTEFKEMISAREGLDQTAGQVFEANVATIASSGIAGQAARLQGMESREGENAFTAEQLEKQRSALIQYGKDLGGINPTIADLFSQYEKGEISTEKLTDGLKNVTTKAGAQNTAFKQINNTISGFVQQYGKISKRNPLDELLSSYNNLDQTIKLTGDNKESVVQKIYESVFGARAEGTSLDDMTAALDRFAVGLKGVIDTRRQLETDALDNKLAGATNAYKTGAAATFAKEDIKKEDLRIAREKAQNKVNELALNKQMSIEDEHQFNMAKKQLAVAQEQEKAYTHSVSLAGKLQNTFSQGIQKMFEDIATGSASAKDAFKSLATLVLQEMAKIAAMKMAASVTGFLGFAQGGIIPVRGMASGGYTAVGQKRFGTGGIATSPTIMVGEGRYNEAVVPLPDGRRIPVEMMGSGAGQNNVTINIDAGGNASSTGNAEQAHALGMSIQAAVMETLQREKRPGGVLGGG
jgi:hypothetical protein